MEELLRQRSREPVLGVGSGTTLWNVAKPQNSNQKRKRIITGEALISLQDRFKIHIPFCVSLVEQRRVSILSLSFVAVNGTLLDLAGRTSSFLDAR